MKGRVAVVILSIVGLFVIALVLRNGRTTGAPLDASALADAEADAEAGADAGADADVEPDAATDAQPDAVVAEDAGNTASCAMVAQYNQSILSAVDAGQACAHAPDVGCATTVAGVTWAYRLVRATAVDGNTVARGSADWLETNCTSRSELELVREAPDGGVTTMPGFGVTLDYGPLTDQNAIGLVALTDYDGDGEAELLRTTDVRMHEASPRHSSQVLTFVGGRLVPYAKAPREPIERAQDIDGDGRLDLVGRGKYAGVTMKNVFGSDVPVAPVVFAAHAMETGGFSATDIPAMAFTEHFCPQAPALDLADAAHADKAAEIAEAVVCARVWGKTEAEVVAAWKKACAGFDAGSGDPLGCQPWPTKLAAIAPPFTLH